MTIKSTLDEQLARDVVAGLRRDHEEEAAQHTPSGRLSAGQLGKPLLEQVLKVIGVPPKPVEDYALGLFKRGNSVEDVIADILQPEETQKEVSYRGVIGFTDAIKDGRLLEIKSVKNSQFPYLDPSNKKRRRGPNGLEPVYGGPKYAHALQGGLYALGLGLDEFTIIYASADDLRTLPHIVKTEDVKPEIDRIIDEVNKQLGSGTLPKWSAREEWQAKYPKYSNYPDWMSLEPDVAIGKLERQYPDAYKKLQGFGAIAKTTRDVMEELK